MPCLVGLKIASKLQELVFKGLLDSIPRIHELIRLDEHGLGGGVFVEAFGYGRTSGRCQGVKNVRTQDATTWS